MAGFLGLFVFAAPPETQNTVEHSSRSTNWALGGLVILWFFGISSWCRLAPEKHLQEAMDHSEKTANSTELQEGIRQAPHEVYPVRRLLDLALYHRNYDLAREAGADYVGAQDMVEKITKENFFDYDVVVATPDMMGIVGRLGKILGPKGLMPSPKAGTVTPNLTQAINEVKAGKIEYRLDKTNIIHCPIGKVSFGPEKLQENYDALIGAIIKAKPAAAKGQYIRSCVTASTMGPGVKINAQKQL